MHSDVNPNMCSEVVTSLLCNEPGQEVEYGQTVNSGVDRLST